MHDLRDDLIVSSFPFIVSFRTYLQSSLDIESGNDAQWQVKRQASRPAGLCDSPLGQKHGYWCEVVAWTQGLRQMPEESFDRSQ